MMFGSEHADLMRAAVRGHDELIRVLRTELRWRVEVDENAQVVRLRKRPVDPQANRGPVLVRRHNATRRPAGSNVLVLIGVRTAPCLCLQLSGDTSGRRAG
jgi:hypothetical protein